MKRVIKSASSVNKIGLEDAITIGIRRMYDSGWDAEKYFEKMCHLYGDKQALEICKQADKAIKKKLKTKTGAFESVYTSTVIESSSNIYNIPKDVYELISYGFDLYKEFYMISDADLQDRVDETCQQYKDGKLSKQDLEDWVWGLEADLNKNQEERDNDAKERLSKYDEQLAEEAYYDFMRNRYERDEWDDYWDSRGV